MSVDVQDSTAFKQQADGNDPAPWRDYFLAFFHDFPSEVERCLSSDAPRPRTWKLLGDEIVFTHPLRRLEELAALLVAFRTAVESYKPKVEKPRNLRLKGSAWVAGFPVGNAVVPVNYHSDRGAEDYIGPSMDTGFRLSHVASRRKFVVSVELAWLLLSLPAARRKRLPLYYEGRCQLKGVMERDGYPLIWTDLFYGKPPPLLAAEDALKRIVPPNPVALRRFCERYIRHHGEPRFVPFIPRAFDRRTAKERVYFSEQLKSVTTIVRRLRQESEIANLVPRRGRRKEGADKLQLIEFKRLLGRRV